jgi:hypothetical protein
VDPNRACISSVFTTDGRASRSHCTSPGLVGSHSFDQLVVDLHRHRATAGADALDVLDRQQPSSSVSPWGTPDSSSIASITSSPPTSMQLIEVQQETK